MFGFVVVVVFFIVCSSFINGLPPETTRNTTVVEQSGLLLVLVAETVHPWGAIRHLSKEALEKTYYGIWVCFRWFEGRTKKVGLCSVLGVLRKGNSVDECLNKFYKMRGMNKILKSWGNESRLKLCIHISQYRGMFGPFLWFEQWLGFVHVQTWLEIGHVFAFIFKTLCDVDILWNNLCLTPRPNMCRAAPSNIRALLRMPGWLSDAGGCFTFSLFVRVFSYLLLDSSVTTKVVT